MGNVWQRTSWDDIEFEDEASVSNDKAANYGKHHEDTVSFRNRFVSDVNKLVQGFNVNPFDLNHLTAINNVTITFSEEVAESIKSISSLGEQLFLQFWNERLIQAKVPISAKITNNNLKLPAHLDSTSSVNDPYLPSSVISKLRSAYQYRPSRVKKLFENEIFGIAQSISSNSKYLYKGKKSEIMKKFVSSSKDQTNFKSSIVIELSAVIHSRNFFLHIAAFNHFAELIYNYIVNVLSSQYVRIDIVADGYFIGSSKEGTRDKRGSPGSKLSFSGSTKFP